MFVQNLKRILRERRLSQKEFLEALGLNKNAFATWEKGAMPRKSTIQQIANYLNIDADMLLSDMSIDDIPEVWESKVADTAYLPLSEQEKSIFEMYRALSGAGQLRVAQAVLNIFAKEQIG